MTFAQAWRASAALPGTASTGFGAGPTPGNVDPSVGVGVGVGEDCGPDPLAAFSIAGTGPDGCIETGPDLSGTGAAGAGAAACAFTGAGALGGPARVPGVVDFSSPPPPPPLASTRTAPFPASRLSSSPNRSSRSPRGPR